MKIVHLTSVHQRNDIRIFEKQSKSLSTRFNVFLIVADGLGNAEINNIKIIDVGKSTSRIHRMFETTKLIYNKAIELNADSYHLHDPELLPVALKLKKSGKVVIFDAHEDFPKQVLTKPYLNPIVAKLISIFMKSYEEYVCSKLDAVVTATPTIRDKFAKFCPNVIDINNYPLLGELTPLDKDWSKIQNEIAYVGGITKIRGIEQVVDAFSLLRTNAKLNLVGTCNEKTTTEIINKKNGWNSVNALGQLNREQVREVLQKSIAGLVTFLPVPNHIDAQPNKMFEYMSAGIPVIGSNYPLWKSIIEGNNCGICVDPEHPQEIANAIDRLVNDKTLAEQMGKNGIKAVNEKYNWSIEETKLFQLYEELLGN
jgi:glycosyltransferase involved in cell wall biosynthesis